MAKEYIEREEALSAIKQAFEKGERTSLYIKCIPAADVVEVVRCKDCQGYGHERACPLAASGLSADCVKLPKEDDFCSYGERRKENG